MKAADITPGTDYAVSTQDPYTSRYATVKHVRILEAGVPGWARKHEYGYSYAREGVVDTDTHYKKARKDHARGHLIFLDGTIGKEVRVPLKDVRDTWAKYAAHKDAVSSRKEQMAQRTIDLSLRLEALSTKLPEGLDIDWTTNWHAGYGSGPGYTTYSITVNHDDGAEAAVDALEALVHHASY